MTTQLLSGAIVVHTSTVQKLVFRNHGVLDVPGPWVGQAATRGGMGRGVSVRA